jgi:hypothetical protein
MRTEILPTQTLQPPEPVTAPQVQEIPAAPFTDLRWVQPSAFKMEYELLSAGRRIVTMRFHGLLSSYATAEYAGGEWSLERAGTSQGKIVISICLERREVGVFESGAQDRGGTLSLRDRRKLVLTPGFWKGKGEFRTEEGEPLIRFRSRGLLRTSAEIEVMPAAAGFAELPCVLMLAWYLSVASA